jgi:c-di-GMP-binding flagellar brake protein YcgR
VEQRTHLRVKARSILVSLSNSMLNQPITGFLRDISVGGLKLQKISSTAKVQPGEYECQFVLPNFGKIVSHAEVIGFGNDMEKFGNLFVRMRFTDIKNEDRNKIDDYVKQNQNNSNEAGTLIQP